MVVAVAAVTMTNIAPTAAVTFAFNADRYNTDAVCAVCSGSRLAKRGRGKCKACHGSGGAELNHPRIRFNWGYHDAHHEVKLGHPRTVVAGGEQTPRTVSPTFSWWYAAGYAAGIADAATEAVNSTTSEPAWVAFSGMRSSDKAVAA